MKKLKNGISDIDENGLKSFKPFIFGEIYDLDYLSDGALKINDKKKRDKAFVKESENDNAK